MQTEFTPLLSLGGGALIGLAAVVLMATNGRIAGISGIVSRLLPPSIQMSGLKQGLLFVVGMLVSIPLYKLATGAVVDSSIPASLPVLVLAGLLVGFGSVLGNGCTSGHGVCGISRVSSRSIIATVMLMFTAFASPRAGRLDRYAITSGFSSGDDLWSGFDHLGHDQSSESAELSRFIWHLGSQSGVRDGWCDCGPTRSDLDARLLIGAAIFGVGWGLGGYCPGPAVTALSDAASGTVAFVVAMLIGMCGAKFLQRN